jgi:hypothetical protein
VSRLQLDTPRTNCVSAPDRVSDALAETISIKDSLPAAGALQYDFTSDTLSLQVLVFHWLLPSSTFVDSP